MNVFILTDLEGIPGVIDIEFMDRKNEKYLGRLFKKEMGISFSEYCIGLRLEKAEESLLKSNDKIIDIALDCGFNNISYFNRVFRKKHNVSPGEYRELKLKNVY